LNPKVERDTIKDFPDGIPSFGTDALRFTFAAMASTGRDINFDMGRIEGYRNFCNKLWNAARYVLMNTEGQDCGATGNQVELSSADRWIVSQLHESTEKITDSIRQYRLDHAAQTIYAFAWDEYCDWYLELSKPVLTNPDSSEAAMRGTRQTLVQVLETLLRLAHPLIPFITEEIWQRVAPLAGKQGDTIMLQAWPEQDSAKLDQDAVVEMAWVKEFVLGIRKIRSGMNIKPGKQLQVLLQNGSAQDASRLKNNRHYIESLARVDSITWLETDDAPESATALVGEMKVLIPMAGLIDKDAELARLNKELEKKRAELERTQVKLGKSSFVDKAPAAIVEKEKSKAADAQVALTKLEEQIQRIKTM
jgi:valyl-tRNA synthetase